MQALFRQVCPTNNVSHHGLERLHMPVLDPRASRRELLPRKENLETPEEVKSKGVVTNEIA